MMDETVQLSFITPGFCAGANQNQAELRVPAIRGQLRWWFRVLGGDAAAEKRVFGGISHGGGDEKPQASHVCLRIAKQEPVYGTEEDLPKPNSPRYYLFHFARVSGNNDGIHRYRNGAWLAPGSSFELRCLQRRHIEADRDRALFQRAWQAFLLMGSLGLRQTRGLGAFAPQQPLPLSEFMKEYRACMPEIPLWAVVNAKGNLESFAVENEGWKRALTQLEAALGWIRQHGLSAGQYGNEPTPLGRSAPERQASALHLRPVLVREGILPMLFYTPQILAPESRAGGLEDKLDTLEFRTPYRQKKKDDNAADASDGRPTLSLKRLR